MMTLNTERVVVDMKTLKLLFFVYDILVNDTEIVNK